MYGFIFIDGSNMSAPYEVGRDFIRGNKSVHKGLTYGRHDSSNYVLSEIDRERIRRIFFGLADRSQNLPEDRILTDDEQHICWDFAVNLCETLISYPEQPQFEMNIQVILDSLREIIQENEFENCILRSDTLIKTFLKSDFNLFSPKKIGTDLVKRFYKILNNSSSNNQEAIIKGIRNRLSSKSVIIKE